jgi:RNA 3'-terminal phosphate cyclase-like protein
MDTTVDSLRTTTLPLLRRFGVDGDIQLQIKKRGAPPLGGGEVVFVCPMVKQLTPIHLMEEGFVKRVRGVAYSTRVSPQNANRMVEAARGVLNAFLPDVHIFTDHYKGSESGKSPGFGLSLVAKTTEDCLISAECTASQRELLPEDVGRKAALMLCQEVANRGCVDTSNQALVLLLMVLGPEDVSKVRLGKLSPYTIGVLRHIRDFFGTTFKIAPDAETKTVVLSCMGTGYKNLARSVC